MRYHIFTDPMPQEAMPAPFAPAGAAVSRVALPGGPVTVVEVWDRTGRTGLGAAPGWSDSTDLLDRCRAALGRPLTDRLAPSSVSDPGTGALETARADLAARIAGLPLWLWLGGAARPRVPDPLEPEARLEALVADRPHRPPPAELLERRADVIRVHPASVGGPAGVARIDALARVFRFALSIVVETPLRVSRELAHHLTVASLTASLPPTAAGPAVEVPWLEVPDHSPDDRLLGLGLTVDRALLAAAAVSRVTVGQDPSA
jgi:L-alanine-DL-glutamate epimerase-like enolase superfamily enzyme